MEQSVIKKSVVIIGGGWSGLSVAGALHHDKVDDYLLLEQTDCFGGFWKHHTYDSVRMHDLSRLYNTPVHIDEKYKDHFLTREEVVTYLGEYADYYGITNHTLFNFQVTHISNSSDLNYPWIINGTNILNGTNQTFICKYLCVATSYCRVPFIPNALKQSMSLFEGQIVHSGQYKNPHSFNNITGKRILIIGGGHSASEIATELADSGYDVFIAYRSGQYFMKQEDWSSYLAKQDLGKAIESWKCSMNDQEFVSLLDQFNSQFSSLIYNINEDIHWPKPSLPPASFLVLHKKTFIDDPHFFDLLRSGKVRMIGPVETITKTGVQFQTGECQNFDGIVLCTGFRHGLEDFLENADQYLSSHRFPHLPPEKYPLPVTDGRCKSLAKPNLFFPGFDYGINQRVDFAVYCWHVGKCIAQELKDLTH